MICALRVARRGVLGGFVAWASVACGSADSNSGLTAGQAASPERDAASPTPVSTGTDGTTTVSTPPVACLPALASCDDPSSTCCEGSVCVERSGVKRCVQTCTTRFDCGSLCCVDDADAGRKLCGDVSQCPPVPCSDVGGSCSQPGPSCCAGLACVSSASSVYAGCRTPCTTSSDCSTSCCVPYASGPGGFCADSSACQCAAADAPCGGTQHCCTGLSCTTSDSSGAFSCKPTCKTNGDCASGCCVPIAGTAESACQTKSVCGG
ncbi:MAG TPA: hypothetical protein VH142_25550 [Polyangiaceae bacterium]|nr:hypothetical protein [Polyangiaceae bacterium]